MSNFLVKEQLQIKYENDLLHDNLSSYVDDYDRQYLFFCLDQLLERSKYLNALIREQEIYDIKNK